MKKKNHYRLKLSTLNAVPKELSIVIENHDDIFKIMQCIEEKKYFSDAAASAGLCYWAEVA